MQGITIVTPSLNQARYLEQCIDSVLSQNYPNLEYIVMDGGSTDGSVEIIKKYERHLAYWQSRPDEGHYQAINEGFRRSTKPVMGWINSDDMMHKDGLAILNEVFTARPEVEFLTGKRIGFDAEGFFQSFDYLDQTWCHDLLLSKELIRKFSLFVMQEGTYWRRGLWERAGGRLDTEYSLAADFELWMRMSRHAALHTVNALTGGFRCYGMEQRCNKHRGEYIEQCLRVIDRELALNLPEAPHRATPPPLILYPLRKASPAPFTIHSKKAPPRISIVTPSFNQADYLEECIDSVLSQNYPDLEYIVMDGGSSDGSAEIIKKYARHLNHWQSKKDYGQYHAVNTGFLISTGEIMAWLNSDDKYHPGALRLVADTFSACPEVKWLTGSPTLWDRDGNVLGFSSKPPVYSREKYLNGEIHSPYIQQESTFWRRSLWLEAGSSLSPDFPLAADMELWARFFRHARLQTLHAPLGGFRSHPGEGQRSEAFASRYAEEAQRIVARERALFEAGPERELLAAPEPLQVADVVRRSGGSGITGENFSMFHYSRRTHFPYFSCAEEKGSGVGEYQELLVRTFLKQNLPPGARVLLLADGCDKVAAQAGYELTSCREADLPAALRGLPERHFDLAVGVFPVPSSPPSPQPADPRPDLARVLKPGACALLCFEVLFADESYLSHPLLGMLRRDLPWARRLPPLQQVALDPFAFAVGTVRDGIRFSYQILWDETAPHASFAPQRLSLNLAAPKLP